MKTLMLVLMAVLIAGSAMAERVEGPGVPKIIGTVETPALDDQGCFSIEADGSEFMGMAGPLGSGSIYAAVGNFSMLLDPVSATWCSDFCVLFGNEDLSEIYIQIGGFSTYGATLITVYGWDGQGGSGETSVVDAMVDLAGSYDLEGYYMFMGNGYNSGGFNIWEGCVDFLGDAVATEDISMGSIKALYR